MEKRKSNSRTLPYVGLRVSDPGRTLAFGFAFLLSIVLPAGKALGGWAPFMNDIYHVTYTDDAGNAAAVGENGLILTTYQMTWMARESKIGESLCGVDISPNGRGVAVGMNGAITRTVDGGATWTVQASAATHLLAVDMADSNTGTAVGSFGHIVRTSDGGATWTAQTSGTAYELRDVCLVDASIGTAVGFGGTILRTTNGGISWAAQSSGTTQDLFGVSFVGIMMGYAVGRWGTILKTTDGGAHWSALVSGTGELLFDVCFTDADTGTVVGSNGLIMRTTDGGANWTTQASGTTMELRGVCFRNQNNGIAVGLDGVIIGTVDGGGTGIGGEPGNGSWSKTAVFKVTPNPFTSYATVPGCERDQFNVYDMSGRRVGDFKGDRVGQGLPSGIYLMKPADGGTPAVKILKIR